MIASWQLDSITSATGQQKQPRGLRYTAVLGACCFWYAGQKADRYEVPLRCDCTTPRANLAGLNCRRIGSNGVRRVSAGRKASIYFFTIRPDTVSTGPEDSQSKHRALRF